MITLSRRGLIGAFIAAPAIVRASSLMPVRNFGGIKEIYDNHTIRYWMDVEAIRDRNVLLNLDVYAGEPVYMYRGVPVRVI